MNAGMGEWHSRSGYTDMCKGMMGHRSSVIALWWRHSGPGKTELWCPSTAQIGTKMMHLPKPRSRVWIVPVSYLLGRLPLIPAGDTPFHTACTARWMHVIRGANMTRWVLLGLEEHCIMSILGPWVFPLTVWPSCRLKSSLLEYHQWRLH